MKKLFLFTIVLFSTVVVYGQKTTAKANVEVDGVCGMCKARIEKAAIKTKGVKTANWDIGSHQLSLVYNEKKTDLKTIQQNIANVGQVWAVVANVTPTRNRAVQPVTFLCAEVGRHPKGCTQSGAP